ncbi:MAG: hypothetical protein KA313_00255 [Pseudarcicella sp.]|jgi:hypothetical protein|nr:hypothetical protein [Pseudarcicella sp.]MBP6409510.1 hypothetical protein [Pseudarcicella sp.]
MSTETTNIEKKTQCEHHEECMKMIQLILDCQASVEQIQHFKDNMSKCTPCENGYELEKSIKEALNLKLEKKCVPSKLASFIRDSIKNC